MILLQNIFFVVGLGFIAKETLIVPSLPSELNRFVTSAYHNSIFASNLMKNLCQCLNIFDQTNLQGKGGCSRVNEF